MMISSLSDSSTFRLIAPESIRTPLPDPAPLPVPLSQMFGREHEVDEIVALLRNAEVSVLTLTGPGGVGKTRLALHVARMIGREFADGVRYLSFAYHRDPEMFLPTIARDLGL